MAPIKCCVIGCSSINKTHRLYCLPKDDKLRALWMSFLVPVNSELLGLSVDQLLNKRVCQKHFERNQLDYKGNRLKYGYPSLFSAKEIEHGVPLPGDNRLSDHQYCKLEDIDEVLGKPVDVQGSTTLDSFQSSETPSTSRCEITSGDSHLRDHGYYKLEDIKEVLENPVDIQEHPGHHLYSKQATNPASSSSNTGFTKLDSFQSSETPSTSRCEITSDIIQIDILGSQAATVNTLATPKIYQRKLKTKCTVQRTLGKMTEKGRCFMKKIKKLAVENRTSPENTFSKRYSNAKELSVKLDFVRNLHKLTPHAQNFLLMQLKLAGKMKRAARFTTEEKLFSLSLLKESPKGYRFLQKIFQLPSKRTLNRLSENICFSTGINKPIFNLIEKKTRSWPTMSKLCSVVFDEVALTPHLNFVESKDQIQGFVDIGKQKIFKLCDHALVIMIRGMCRSWRQPVAYYFCEGTIPSDALATILKEVIYHVKKSGLIPLALVCDQGQTFRKTFKTFEMNTNRQRILEGQNNDNTICISGQDLYIIHDPPHLLKSIRNNLLTKDMLFKGKEASWRDIETIFELDSQLGHTRMLPKITEHHVVKEKIKKMKVCVAAQVLSARTSAMLKYTATFTTHQSGQTVSSTMKTTGDAVEFFDKLFDSVNGSRRTNCRGKLRGPVTIKSKHVQFWQDALKVIEDIRFIEKSSKRALRNNKSYLVMVPCLEGWKTTLKSFIGITKLLLDKYKIEYYYTRNINQDPLENFFGRIRALNYRNVHPDPYTFINAFKSLLISNIMGPHSIYSNCEEDSGDVLIDFYSLFEEEQEADKENLPLNVEIPPSAGSNSDTTALFNQAVQERTRVHSSAYTAGYICRKMRKKISCQKCVKTFTTTNVDNIHTWIKFREYKSLKNNNLAYPTKAFLLIYRDCADLIHSYLNSFAPSKNVATNIKSIIKSKINLKWLGCEHHKLIVQNEYLKLVARLHIHNWCNIINKILNGKISEKYAKQMKKPQNLALAKFKSLRCKKKKINT